MDLIDRHLLTPSLPKLGALTRTESMTPKSGHSMWESFRHEL